MSLTVVSLTPFNIPRTPSSHDKIVFVVNVKKTYVVVPAYNEAPALAGLIPRILQDLTTTHRSFEVVIVNDGSSDDTSHLLDSLSIRELRHTVNRGYGIALKTGFLWVLGNANSEDAVVTLDADNTHDPAYIPQLIDTLDVGFDGVTASYTMDGGHSYGVPIIRRVMSLCLNRMFQYTLRLPGIRTYTNGFRAYRVSALRSVHQKFGDQLIEESGFPGGTELFVKLAGEGGKLTEIPFDLHYEQRGANSKLRLFSTSCRYLRLLVMGRHFAHS